MNININGAGGARRSKPSAASTETETATGKSAKSKLGKIFGGVANVAAKYGNLIPGIGGVVSTLGKLASGNDPEWWQNVKSTGITTNVPLSARTTSVGSYGFGAYKKSNSSQALSGDAFELFPADALRPAILEIRSDLENTYVDSDLGQKLPYVINPTTEEVSTYLMQEIRKVVNAVPLQSAEAYRQVLINGANAYALKKQLEKMIYLSTHSKPFVPAMTDGSFPLLSSANYATLVATHNGLTEYIKASVKLPHTLCQYLSWRFGRIFRMGDSEKSGLVIYNVLPLNATASELVEMADRIKGFAAGPDLYRESDGLSLPQITPVEKQQALADMYNAYLSHVIDVTIPDDSQFSYDRKEFVLRTNLDLVGSINVTNDNIQSEVDGAENVYMDSTLDNPTTFLASTVSTAGTQILTTDFFSGAVLEHETALALFPVQKAVAWIVPSGQIAADGSNLYREYARIYSDVSTLFTLGDEHPAVKRFGSDWAYSTPGAYVGVRILNITCNFDTFSPDESDRQSARICYAPFVLSVALAKAAEFYNVEIYQRIGYSDNGTESPSQGKYNLVLDMTAPATDLGLVAKEVLANTHQYAFANLVFMGVTSYAAKENPAAIKAAETTLEKVVAEAQPGTNVISASTPSEATLKTI